MKYYNFTKQKNNKKSTNLFVFLKEFDFRGAYGKKYQNSRSVSQFDIFPFFGNIEKMYSMAEFSLQKPSLHCMVFAAKLSSVNIRE